MTLLEYVIMPRTKRNAERLDLLIYPSENLKYKIEVYNDNGLFLGYVGNNAEFDYCQMRLINLTIAKRLKEEWIERNNWRNNKLLKLEYKLLWR